MPSVGSLWGRGSGTYAQVGSEPESPDCAPAGGKGTDFGHIVNRGTGEGMAGTVEPIPPWEGDLGVERLLTGLREALRPGNHRPAPVSRVEIPKPEGTKRPSGIPTVKDRVVQQAAKLILGPRFEVDIRDCFGEIDHEQLLDPVG